MWEPSGGESNGRFDASAWLGYKPPTMTIRDLLRALNLANLLTFLRLLALPFFVLALANGRLALAFGLFIAATVTDFFDGLIARWLDQTSPLGALLDPAADKLLMTAGFVMLADTTLLADVALSARIPLWLTVLVIFRDVMIVGLALALYLSYGVRRFAPSSWSKWAVFFEMVTLGSFLLANALEGEPPVLAVLVWVTLGLVLISGFHYLGRTARWLASEERAAR